MIEEIHGAPSWRLENDRVRLAVTRDGAMIAPVEFRLDNGRPVSPYALAPWKPAELDDSVPPLLRVLRGDFFCLPFGPQKDGDPHGASANREWTVAARDDDSLALEMPEADGWAALRKTLSLRPGQTALYQEIRIRGLSGAWSYGSHPILDFSRLPEGAGRLSVSPFRRASVYPGLFSAPERHERQALEPGARFNDLTAVPTADGRTTDLSRYPVRRGNDDLVMMVSEPASEAQPFAWSAAVLDGYVWFSLKNPADFPSTLFWLSNGGRDDAPWNGRHLGRVGIEEVCSHFSDGVETSRQTSFDSIPTVRDFDPERETTLKLIHAVAAVPDGFGRVVAITPAGDGRVTLRDDAGGEVETAVDWSRIL
jgi:hypothetical protein